MFNCKPNQTNGADCCISDLLCEGCIIGNITIICKEFCINMTYEIQIVDCGFTRPASSYLPNTKEELLPTKRILKREYIEYFNERVKKIGMIPLI